MMRSSGTESRGLLSDSDWDEIAKLGIVDVIFVRTPGSGFVTAVALLVHGPGAVQCWSLAERPSHDAARAAVRFLLAALAGLRRLTKQKHPWAPGVGETDTDPERAEARDQAVRAAVDGWHRQVDASIREATLVDGAAACG